MAQVDDILSSINQGSQYGSYGEGSISTGLNALRQLQDQFRNGSLSDKDFISIGDAIAPQLRNKINQLAGGGSSSANAAWAAGGQDVLKILKDYDAVKAGREILGRDITSSDLDSFRPYFEGGTDTGRAYLTQLKQYEGTTPEALKKKAGNYSGDVNQAFRSVLGRDATPQEIEHYGSGLASGGLDSYQLADYIKQTDEYRTGQDKTFREGLNTELSGYDENAFKKGSEDIISRYSKAGIQHSPALDLALTNLMGDIAKERGRYLAGLSAEQYGGNKELARADYEGNLNKYLSDRDYERSLRQKSMDDYLGRSRELTDYDRQKSDYFDMLSRVPRGRRGGGLSGALSGALQGGAAGSPFGPWGSIIGAGAGATYGFFD